jgi:hypothetical protein
MAENKTIELRGGPLNGRRTEVPAGNTQVVLQADASDKFSAWVIYRPTSERCADGTEIWSEYIESQWGGTGLTDL